ncbi:MAG: hypothetical protein WD795_16485 [Woeseia sp.]
MTDQMERALVRLDARIHWQRAYDAAHPIRARLRDACMALRECGTAIYGAARGWRV